MSRWIASMIACCTGLWTATARADVQEDRRAQLIIKAISYDRAIRTRAKDSVMLAVLTTGKECEDALSALQSTARNATVANLPLKVAEQTWTGNVAATEAELTRLNVTVAFVCPDATAHVASIVALARKLDIMTFTGREEDVRAGISIGVVSRGSRPVIMVNTTALKEEGVDLDSGLIRFAGTLR
jgi:hypothetical protein